MPDRMTYERFHDQEAWPQLDAFLPAYEEIYAEPPYNEGPSDVAGFVGSYTVHAAQQGIRLVLARDGDDVVGFAYGYPLPSITGWWRNVDRPLSDDFMREDGIRTWAILELAVRAPWRRRGIARALHTYLLNGLDAERVTLTVRPEPEASPAQSAYAAWGYRSVGVARPWEDAPLYTAMVLDLAGRRADA
ncbi:hypothetical protein GCM10010387_15320 [Streptomyces inusitatus]|uniref:N-acetyltransferase domain-containing protein n=1 Tax=Streptomyces inusitatus TaxID=68221 RepID=A0A918PUH9_9ACTN|nr:GNAT family N-acetyltransferase [Streptomyces inusitatus]GGZ23156.1 hypothetical protein GCM10010387_15320 [Streptomyces inusitatus]